MVAFDATDKDIYNEDNAFKSRSISIDNQSSCDGANDKRQYFYDISRIEQLNHGTDDKKDEKSGIFTDTHRLPPCWIDVIYRMFS